MRNIIPVITAVILGLAAVFAVSRVMAKQTIAPEPKVAIVAASQNLNAGDTITEDFIYPKMVSVSSLPQQRILWDSHSIVLGQKALMDIVKNDYILLSNIGLSSSMGNIIGRGEWGVPVTFDDRKLLSVLQPGDEIAIIGIFKVKVELKTQKDTQAEQQSIEKTVSTVLYPRVRILEKVDKDSVILSMPPQQAIALLNLQENCKLFPLLRRTNDEKGLNRKDGGIFEESTLTKLINELEPIKIPDVATDVSELPIHED